MENKRIYIINNSIPDWVDCENKDKRDMCYYYHNEGCKCTCEYSRYKESLLTHLKYNEITKD